MGFESLFQLAGVDGFAVLDAASNLVDLQTREKTIADKFFQSEQLLALFPEMQDKFESKVLLAEKGAWCLSELGQSNSKLLVLAGTQESVDIPQLLKLIAKIKSESSIIN